MEAKIPIAKMQRYSTFFKAFDGPPDAQGNDKGLNTLLVFSEEDEITPPQPPQRPLPQLNPSKLATLNRHSTFFKAFQTTEGQKKAQKIIEELEKEEPGNENSKINKISPMLAELGLAINEASQAGINQIKENFCGLWSSTLEIFNSISPQELEALPHDHNHSHQKGHHAGFGPLHRHSTFFKAFEHSCKIGENHSKAKELLNALDSDDDELEPPRMEKAKSLLAEMGLCLATENVKSKELKTSFLELFTDTLQLHCESSDTAAAALKDLGKVTPERPSLARPSMSDHRQSGFTLSQMQRHSRIFGSISDDEDFEETPEKPDNGEENLAWREVAFTLTQRHSTFFKAFDEAESPSNNNAKNALLDDDDDDDDDEAPTLRKVAKNLLEASDDEDDD